MWNEIRTFIQKATFFDKIAKPTAASFPSKPVNEVSTFTADRFKMTIDMYPNTTWWLTGITTPTISNQEVRVAGPGGVYTMLNGDRLTYSPFTVDFTVDANLATYRELFEWLHFIVSKKEHNHHLDVETSGMIYFTSPSNVPVWKLKLKGLKIIDLAGLTLGLSGNGEYLTSSATFNIDLMEFEQATEFST